MTTNPSRLLILLALSAASALAGAPTVETIPTPGGGVQPQVAVGDDGAVHLLYFRGEAASGDLFYVRSSDGGRTFSAPLRVNSQPGAAVAAGAIRGGQIALGRDGRVHVAWNGSSVAEPKGPLNPHMKADSPYNGTPLLYARLNDAGDAFERQRNVMTRTYALDGGATIAADEEGGVWIAWHAAAPGAPKGEEGRRVWVVRSSDGGKTFTPEEAVFGAETGACACCGMKIHAGREGTLYALYRSARETVHRDVYLLESHDKGKSFDSKKLHEWEIGACPMSSMSFHDDARGLLAGWETAQQVYFARVERGSLSTSEPVSAPGEAPGRKHPRLARNEAGQTLLVWTEVPGWAKPGVVRWQLFDKDLQPVGKPGGGTALPVWSFGATFARKDGTFVVVK